MLQRLRSRAGGQEGFTLIELLVVVLIIGILAAVAIPSFLNQKGKAQDANVQSDARTLATAEETYFTTNGTYIGTATTSTVTGAAAALEAIEPTLTSAFTNDTVVIDSPALATDSYLSSVAGSESALQTTPVQSDTNSYDIDVVSPSGVDYAILRDSNGITYLTCKVPSGTNAAGCKLASGSTSGNGVW